MGYQSAFINQKTSLKKQCVGSNCLASEFDNIWFNKSRIKKIASEVLPFYKSFQTLKEARTISDHIPITLEFMAL